MTSSNREGCRAMQTTSSASGTGTAGRSHCRAQSFENPGVQRARNLHSVAINRTVAIPFHQSERLN